MNKDLSPLAMTTFCGALAVALPDLAPDFGGDLLTLTVLDLFASRYNVPFSLSKVWEKLLNAGDTIKAVINQYIYSLRRFH